MLLIKPPRLPDADDNVYDEEHPDPHKKAEMDPNDLLKTYHE